MGRRLITFGIEDHFVDSFCVPVLHCQVGSKKLGQFQLRSGFSVFSVKVIRRT